MINIHKHIILLLIFILGNSPLFAQKYMAGKTEVGFIIGGANYHGDLAPSIKLGETSWHAGINLRRNRSSHISYRAQLSAGQISGSDQNFSAYKYRNLSFKATILELSGMVEFNFNKFGINFNDGRFSPYIATGLSLFYMDPVTTYNGNEYNLNQFQTELVSRNGGTKKLFPIQPAVPLVFGVKWAANRKGSIILGAEVGFRKTFTDYLDNTSNLYTDYNQLILDDQEINAHLGHREMDENTDPIDKNMMRGDPHLKDWFIFAGFTVSFKFTVNDDCPSI